MFLSDTINGVFQSCDDKTPHAPTNTREMELGLRKMLQIAAETEISSDEDKDYPVDSVVLNQGTAFGTCRFSRKKGKAKVHMHRSENKLLQAISDMIGRESGVAPPAESLQHPTKLRTFCYATHSETDFSDYKILLFQGGVVAGKYYLTSGMLKVSHVHGEFCPSLNLRSLFCKDGMAEKDIRFLQNLHRLMKKEINAASIQHPASSEPHPRSLDFIEKSIVDVRNGVESLNARFGNHPPLTLSDIGRTVRGAQIITQDGSQGGRSSTSIVENAIQIEIPDAVDDVRNATPAQEESPLAKMAHIATILACMTLMAGTVKVYLEVSGVITDGPALSASRALVTIAEELGLIRQGCAQSPEFVPTLEIVTEILSSLLKFFTATMNATNVTDI